MAFTHRNLVTGEPLNPRPVIVIVGDGHDNASSHTLKEVLELAQRQQVTIYGVSTTSYGFGNDADDDTLAKLTDGTGGKIEYPLQHVYRDINGYLEVPTDGGNYQFDLGTGGRTRRGQGQQCRARHCPHHRRDHYAVHPALCFQQSHRLPNSREYPSHDVALPGVKVRARPSYYPLAVSDSASSSH